MANADGKHRAKKKDDQAFDPGTALEQLHTVIVRLEALSQAVMNTFEFLPRVEDASGRRTLEHTCALTMVLDEEIGKAVAASDEMNRTLPAAPGRGPIFHGHVRTWGQLEENMQDILIENGVVDSEGNILVGGGE
jgi:hypothetical protein